MKKLLLFSAAVAFATSAHAADKPMTEHPEFPAEGYEVIFDGSDLSKIKTEGNWKIRDDKSLELVPREGEKGWERYGSYLWLPGEYEDFVADLEFKFEEGGNSGLYFRISDESDATAHGWELQLLDSYGNDKPLSHHDMGGVIKTNPAMVNASIKPGEWNRVTARLEGSHLTVLLNGKLIQDFDIMEKKPADKEFAEKGKIAIQDHGQPLQVRNVQVKRL